jgi:type II secretory pathway predicted ATPase ExeA
MYNAYFGFNEKPFEVTPDPKFLYMTRAYQEILSALIYGIHERRGFIAIVGEVGTGKTMMINALLDRLEHHTKVAFIFNSDLTFQQMLTMALCDLGLANADEKLSKVEAIQRLNDYAIAQLEKGGNVVIIIDEAQSLNHKTMENLRMLSNLETRKHKLVQIILSGQPELDAKLNLPEWRQLVQRISLKRYSMNLSEQESYGYIQHRLDVAGYGGAPLFSPEALQMIWQYSEGIPRKINILCDNALLIGYGIEQKEINKEIIQEAIKDLSWSPFLDTPGSPYALPGNARSFAVKQADPAVPLQLAAKPEKPESPLGAEFQAPHVRTSIDSEETGRAKPLAQDLQPSSGKDSFSPEGIEIQSPDEIHVHENIVAPQGVLRNTVNPIRLSLIAGILLLLSLIIGAWFLFTRSEFNFGQYLFSSRQMVRTEATELLNSLPDRTGGQAESRMVEDWQTLLTNGSQARMR